MPGASEVEYYIYLRDKFSRPLNNINKNLDQTGSKVSGFGKMAKIAFTGLVAAGIGRMALSVIKLGADLEQTEVSFSVMLGSMEKAKTMIAGINEFANVTPFSNETLLESAKLMMNFGIESEQVMGNLKMLGDVAGGDANKMKLITLAFSQVNAAGKLMGQDLLQLINAGFNPLQEISRTTGQSLSDLKDQMSAGGISFQMVSDAFKTATSEGGRFFQMMEKQSKTAAGMWSTFTGKLSFAAAEVGRKFIPKIVEGLSAVTPLIDGFGTKTIEIIDRIAKHWHFITESFAGLKESFFGVWESVKKLLESMGLLSEKGDNIKGTFENLKAVLTPIVTVLRLIAKAFSWVIDGVSETIEMFKLWYVQGGAFKELVDFYIIKPLKAVGHIFDWVKGLLDDQDKHAQALAERERKRKKWEESAEGTAFLKSKGLLNDR